MYKLLTTTAVILAVATPTLANDWKGHKDLVNKLEQTYGYLDGEKGFNDLQGEYGDGTGTGLNSNGTATNGGQLSNFFNLVDQGVTYITLTVGTDHQITPGINNGVAFSQINDAKDELVDRVNYDLFVDTTADNFDKTKGAEYVDVKNQGLILDGTPSNGTGDNEYTSNQNGGYAGVKITNLVDTTNQVNNYLVDSGTSATDNTDFQAAFAAGTGTIITGVDGEGNNITVDLATDFFGQITDLNGAIGLTTDSTDGTFFGNIDTDNVSETTINNFAIPDYNSFDSIGNPTTSIGFTSISNWASGVHTVVVDTGSSTITTDGSVAITDAAAGTVTVSGSTDSTDGLYTLTGGVFVKG